MSETRKLAAILVSDVVGYSRLAGADEDRTLSRLRKGNLEETKAALAEALRLNPKLTAKSMRERYPDFPWISDVRRKGGCRRSKRRATRRHCVRERPPGASGLPP